MVRFDQRVRCSVEPHLPLGDIVLNNVKAHKAPAVCTVIERRGVTLGYDRVDRTERIACVRRHWINRAISQSSTVRR
jgi:hypothetical protein